MEWSTCGRDVLGWYDCHRTCIDHACCRYTKVALPHPCEHPYGKWGIFLEETCMRRKSAIEGCLFLCARGLMLLVSLHVSLCVCVDVFVARGDDGCSMRWRCAILTAMQLRSMLPPLSGVTDLMKGFIVRTPEGQMELLLHVMFSKKHLMSPSDNPEFSNNKSKWKAVTSFWVLKPYSICTL